MVSTPSDAPVELTEPLMHRAARFEKSLHDFRERRARRRGLVPTIIPYTGYGGAGWIRVLGRVLLARIDEDRVADHTPQYRSIRGWRSFTSVSVSHGDVTITVAGEEHVVAADRGGVIDVTLPIGLPDGWNTISLSADGSDPVETKILVVGADVSFGLISDIDDTVMVTALPRPFLAAWNTFVLHEHARRPVAGMAVLYERIAIANPGAPVVYLSTGAWNVAPTLGRFLSRHLYPPGPLLLTDWGPTHDRWFRSGKEHKRENLRRLAADFPGVQWMLVGDDGQHDESLYAEFAAEHPDNVRAVCIRQLSAGEAVLAGGRSKDEFVAGRDEPWYFATDGAGLAEQLAADGVIAIRD